MTNKKIKNRLAKGIVVLMTPVVVNIVGDMDIEANASVRGVPRTSSLRSSSISNISRSSGVNSLRPSNLGTNPNVKYKLSTGEKALGGVALGVAGVSVGGTIAGIALSEKQYNQNVRTYEEIIERNYNAFYDEREKFMSDLFNRWGVPMPEEYKNPLGNKDKDKKPTPGFSFGGGQ